jgi:hypothetical protein
MIDLYLCPSNPQCAECHFMLEVRPLENGLHKVIHSYNTQCSNSNKHFIVRFPRLEVLAASEAVEAPPSERRVMMTELADMPRMDVRQGDYWNFLQGTGVLYTGGNRIVYPITYTPEGT